MVLIDKDGLSTLNFDRIPNAHITRMWRDKSVTDPEFSVQDRYA